MIPIIRHFWPGFLWWNVVMALTLAPGNYFPKVGSFWSLFSPDKLIHLFIFGVLAYLLLSAFRNYFTGPVKAGRIFAPMLITLSTGILTEILQAVLPIGREASVYDSIANAIGCITGYYIFRFRVNKNMVNLRFKGNNE